MRYVVGIDLGTTNCAVAYADVDPEADGEVRGLSIPQVTAPGEVTELAALPSFLLLATDNEVPHASLTLPWDDSPDGNDRGTKAGAVGALARDRGAELPHRLVASAKSWLCHTGVDRSAPILPWQTATTGEAATDGERVSPVDASASYLAHVRAAWNHTFPDDPLEDQDVLLTVPASFDAVARELTVSAAHAAGLDRITLLEEPQAAFYAYLARAADGWRNELSAGDVVLVCDIGGGTTDFSLIAVEDDGAGNLTLERIAVGDHILLGGDNMDLALAHRLSQRLAEEGKKLSAMQQRALTHACRRAKEQLLSANAPESVPISILGRGSKLIGGTIRTELSRIDVETLLIDGFFPEVAAEARPEKRRAIGLRALGLPYVSDPAITRHLAEFLARNDRAPTAILWNGGVMKGERLRKRVADLLATWHKRPKLPSLAGADLDLAVSRGAAYYGLVRHGRGIRIRGGTARSYYIGVEAATPAIPGFAPPVVGLCVAPFGMEEGTSVDVPGEKLGLVVGETAMFRFFASTTRNEDAPGEIAEVDGAEDLVELAPVEAALDAGDGHEPGQVVPVTLQADVTEIGTLSLWCVAEGSGHKWKLEYSLRETEGE